MPIWLGVILVLLEFSVLFVVLWFFVNFLTAQWDIRQQRNSVSEQLRKARGQMDAVFAETERNMIDEVLRRSNE